MGLLSFIKNRNREFIKPPKDPEFNPKAHGHETWKGVYTELRADEALAKQRNETGHEPEGNNQKTMPRPKPSWER